MQLVIIIIIALKKKVMKIIINYYMQSDAYQATGCYNLLCSGFVQTNNKIAIGAAISPTSSYAGGQFDISLLIWKVISCSITKLTLKIIYCQLDVQISIYFIFFLFGFLCVYFYFGDHALFLLLSGKVKLCHIKRIKLLGFISVLI